MKKFLRSLPIILMFLVGLSLLLYPLVANTWNNYRQKRLIASYREDVQQKEATIDYAGEWERAHKYNSDLLPSILPDSFAIADAQIDLEDKASKDGSVGEDKHMEAIKEYMACLNLTGDGMMGLVEIPCIDVSVPIYHTVEKEILEKGAGHLPGSSLPVGGEDTHAVISAHRGLPSYTLFTDLDKVKEGDHFLLHVLDDTLCYEVDQIKTVEPDETGDLNVESGKDLVTLLTCTPYGVNTHRLLVRGHRIPYEPEVAEAVKKEASGAKKSLHTNYLLWVIVGLAVTAVFIIIMAVITGRDIKEKKAELERRGRRRRSRGRR